MKTKIAKILSFVFAPLFVVAIVLGSGLLFQSKQQELAQNPEVEQTVKPYDWSQALASGFSASADGSYDVAELENVLIDLSEGVVPGSDTGATLTRTTIDGDYVPTNMLAAKLVDGKVEVVVRASGKDHYITASTDAEYALGDLLTGGRAVVARGTKLYVADTKGNASLARTTLDGTNVANLAAYTTSDARVATVEAGTLTFKDSTYGNAGSDTTGRAFLMRPNSNVAPTLNLQNITIQRFVNSSMYGSALYAKGGNTYIYGNSNITGCKGGTGVGGAIFLERDEEINNLGGQVPYVYIYGSTNISNCEAAKGGAIYLSWNYGRPHVYLGYSNASTTSTWTGSISGCKATSAEGGAIYANGEIHMASGTLSNNQAVTDGGAIYSGYNYYDITGGTITGNIAGSNGGGIMSSRANGSATISAGIISGNTATSSGGGIYTAGNLTISGTAVVGDSSKTAAAENTSGKYSNYAGTGGGIYINSGATVNLNSGYIAYNNASAGGGVYVSSGTLNIAGGNIQYNIANSSWGTGAGVYSLGSVNMTSGNVKGNYANSWGGGLKVGGGTNTFSGGVIENNVSGGGGGAIEVDADITLSSSIIIRNNTAVTWGGALGNDSAYTINITGGTFSGNSVTHTSDDAYGGFAFNNGALTISGGSFTGHSVTSTASGKNGFGACICNGNSSATLTISGGTFSSNAAYRGGAIYTIGTANITGGTFSGNTSTRGGSFLYVSGGTATVSNGTIQNNVSSYYGGAVYANGGTTNISGGTFSGNQATGGGGGALYAYSAFSITGGTFSGNTASTNGGAIFNSYDGTATISDATIQNNTAGSSSTTGNGGAIYSYYAMTLTGNTISGNRAYGAGGAIHTTSVSISSGTISGNTGTNGGGIFSTGTVTISGTAAIQSNTASGQGGGGIAVVGSSAVLNMTGGTIGGPAGTTNSAAQAGGGIACQNGATLNISGGSISHNTAPIGGGIYSATATDRINISGSANIVTNTATYYSGGGVYCTGILTMTDGNISQNRAMTSGTGYAGGIMLKTNSNNGVSNTISGGTIQNNRCAEDGGGIKADGSVTISGGTISGNQAKNGAGVAVNAGATLTINNANVSVSNNTASGSGGGYGGGLYAYGSGATIALSAGSVTGNTANKGAGIYLSTDSTMNLTGGTISNNTSTYEGGGIKAYRATLSLGGATFSGNSASKGGAIYYHYGDYESCYLNFNGAITMSSNTSTTTGAEQFAIDGNDYFKVNFELTTDYYVWQEYYYTMDDDGNEAHYTFAYSTNATYRTSAFNHLKPSNMPSGMQLDDGNRKPNTVVFVKIGRFVLSSDYASSSVEIPIIVGATVSFIGTEHACNGQGYSNIFSSITISSNRLTLVNGSYIYPSVTMYAADSDYAFYQDAEGEEFYFDGRHAGGGSTDFDLYNGDTFSVGSGIGEIDMDFFGTRVQYTLKVYKGTSDVITPSTMASAYSNSGNNMTLSYDPAGGGVFTLAPSSSSDPYATSNVTAYLTAGRTYYMHARVTDNNGDLSVSGSIKIYYGIGYSFTEANSVTLSDGDHVASFTVSTTGTYNFRFDNDFGTKTVFVRDFWISSSSDDVISTTVGYGKTYALGSPSRTGHTRSSWIVHGGSGSSVSGSTFTMGKGDSTVSAHWTIKQYKVKFAVNNSSYGSITVMTDGNVVPEIVYSNGLNVYHGTPVSYSGNVCTLNTTTVTATPASSTASYDYSLKGWTNGTGTVTAARTITANFSRSASGVHPWDPDPFDPICVTGDTDILIGLDGRTKKAADLQTGDQIVAYDSATGQYYETIVQMKYIRENPPSILNTYYFSDGSYLNITENHALLTADGLKSLQTQNKLSFADNIYAYGGFKRLEYINEYQYAVDVLYNFLPAVGDTFVANGTLVEKERTAHAVKVDNSLAKKIDPICVTGDTDILVSLDGQTKKAKDLKQGDPIVAYNSHTGKFYLTTVYAQYESYNPKNLHRYYFDDGRYLNITSNHALLTNNGFVCMDDENGLAPGAYVQLFDGFATLQLIAEYTKHEDVVYNFLPAIGDAFVANGVLVEKERTASAYKESNKLVKVDPWEPPITCITGDTLVWTGLDGSSTLARNLQIGDQIISYDSIKGKFYVTTVKMKYFAYNVENVYIVTFDDGSTLKITSTHRMLTANGFYNLLDENLLHVGDVVVGRYGNKTVTDIMWSCATYEVVYNFLPAVGDAFVAGDTIIERENPLQGGTLLFDKDSPNILGAIKTHGATISENPSLTGLAGAQIVREEEHAEVVWFDDKHRKLSNLGVDIVTADGDIDGLIV